MIRVLIDACGWKAVMDAGINIDQALLDTVGITNLALLPNVLKELEAIGGNLMLDMLKAKSEIVESPEEVGNHTDDQLLHLSCLLVVRQFPTLEHFQISFLLVLKL